LNRISFIDDDVEYSNSFLGPLISVFHCPCFLFTIHWQRDNEGINLFQLVIVSYFHRKRFNGYRSLWIFFINWKQGLAATKVSNTNFFGFYYAYSFIWTIFSGTISLFLIFSWFGKSQAVMECMGKCCKWTVLFWHDSKETGHLWPYYIYTTVFIRNAANLAQILPKISRTTFTSEFFL
jgi:hypothetical protein